MTSPNDSASSGELYDVLGVMIHSGVVRVMDTMKDEHNADAYVRMAVMRRGVDEEFFVAVPTGRYRDGDKWKGRYWEDASHDL